MLLWRVVQWMGVFIGAYLSTRVGMKYLSGLLYEANFTRANYNGEEIITGAGLIFILITPIWLIFGMFLNWGYHSVGFVFLFLFALLGMGLVGLIDDVMGGQKDKGFIGHFRALLQGRLTSGALKALYGGGIATVLSAGLWALSAAETRVSWVSGTFNFVLNIVLISLTANLLNLLDLRPGRASKVYLLITVIAFFLSKKPELFGLTLPLMAVVLAYMRLDLKGYVMMGDVGSNLLGGVLGLMMAWTFTPWTKTFAFVILLSLNLLSEFVSFSSIIDHWRVLRFLDQIGRGRPD
jgi:UDP-GlcNAc:undecaprenyl-phosphate GlcNAc-1-phosphate transferase